MCSLDLLTLRSMRSLDEEPPWHDVGRAVRVARPVSRPAGKSESRTTRGTHYELAAQRRTSSVCVRLERQHDVPIAQLGFYVSPSHPRFPSQVRHSYDLYRPMALSSHLPLLAARRCGASRPGRHALPRHACHENNRLHKVTRVVPVQRARTSTPGRMGPKAAEPCGFPARPTRGKVKRR